MKKFAVIMAGGSGTRFWPKSSAKNPKQFLALSSKKSQMQLTWQRLNGVVAPSNRYVICTEALKTLTKRHVPRAKILAEPLGRNTMAAVCWSAWEIARDNEDAIVAVLPADAYIKNETEFKKALTTCFEIAQAEQRIVCLGIKPTFAATAYGYIQQGPPLGKSAAGFEIKKFVEKPDHETATKLIASGEYSWNAGIFVFSVSTFVREVRALAPEFATFFDKVINSPQKLKAGYKKLPSIAVDVALMEKTNRGALLEGSFGWNDLGSWPALAEVMVQNNEAGVIDSLSPCMSIDSANNIAHINSKKFLGLIGIENMIVVETETVILICRKDRAQDIKKLTGLIEKKKALAKKLL